MPRPLSMPKPHLRKGAKTYEIRVRVPEASQGDRFKGTHTTRTLSLPARKADNEKDAYRNLPEVHDALMREFDLEAQRLRAAKTQASTPGASTEVALVRQMPDATRALTIPELCRRYRAHVLHWERKRRDVHTWMYKSIPDLRYNPTELAEWYRQHIAWRQKQAHAYWVNRDFEPYEAFLEQIEAAGSLRVPDRRRALHALCRTEVEALAEIARTDRGPGARPSAARGHRAKRPVVPRAEHPARSTAPQLSRFIDDFIARRGGSLSGERSQAYQAVVRDLIEVASDKPVSAYTIADAEAFEEVLRTLPANWGKKRDLKNLSMTAAARKAAKNGLAPQSPKNIRKKWSLLGTVFNQASARHGGTNPFQPHLLQIDKSQSANAQWDAFASDELAKLMGSKLEGPLHWLTRLALYTGARTNELCQLTTDHVKCHEGVHYIHFSPELRLKTGEKHSCVRSVPLRRELVEEGFLDFVAKADGELFPGLTQHSTGRYSDAVGKKFTYHLKKIGLKRPKLSFKSLRHTFVAEFKRCATTDVETRERLIGHAVSGVAGRYGNSYESEALDMELLKVRAAVLTKLRFDFSV